jgi:hypothetical protein
MWIGPFTIQQMLDNCLNDAFPKPPYSGSVYVVSLDSWFNSPPPQIRPLYIGSNTGTSQRFRTRIGDLLADLFGFFGDKGHHSGGRSLFSYCQQHQVHPFNLYLAWVASCDCHRCLENELYRDLEPKLNRKAPPRCSIHRNA